MSDASESPRPYADAAVALYKAGWWPLPLRPGTKWPPPNGYTGADGKIPAGPELVRWLRESPAGNIAIRLPVWMVGIDVDAYDDKPGGRTLAAMEAEHGPLPPTVTISSREDGASGIRLFRLPDDADQAHFRTGWAGIEILRWGHRYVVAPPSLHPSTGRAYVALDQRTGKVLTSLPPGAGLPLLPDTWVAACAKPERVEPDRSAPRALTSLARPVDEYAPCKAMSRALGAAIGQLGSGEARHDVATREALALVRLAEMGHHGGTYALDAFGSEFRARVAGDRQGGAREAAHEWDSIVSTAQGKVAQRPTAESDRGCCGADSTKHSDVDPLLGAKPVDHIAREMTEAVTTDVVAETVEDAEIDPKAARALFVEERLPIIDWHELWADESEEEWIVEPLLPARRLVAMYSAPKVGKSLLMLELAAAVGAGRREVLGTMLGDARVVLYVDFENDPRSDVRERLEAMGYGPDDLDNLRYLSFPTLGGLDSERGSQELMAAVEYHGAELVVIDTVSRSVDGEENENDTWLSFYRHTGLKLKQRGIALIRLDHTGKDERKGQRGGSAKEGDVDAVWHLSRLTETKFRLNCTHHRMPISEPTLVVERLEDPDLRHKVDGDGGRSALRALFDADRVALEALGLPESAGYRPHYEAAQKAGLGLTRSRIKLYLAGRKERAERSVDSLVGAP